MAEAGALPPAIHMAGLNGPQASEDRGHHPHPHPASALPPTPEREPAAGSRGLAQRPRALKGPDPGMAKVGDPEAIPLSEPPSSLEKQVLLCLPAGPHLSHLAGWDGGEEFPDPQKPKPSLPT